MANILKHRYASGKTDGGDATQIQPSHWNDGHAFIGGAAGDVLTRDPADPTYGAKWSTVGTWQAYTPTWMTDPPPGPTLGNGTLSGWYVVIGTTVHFAIRFTYGSTTAGVIAGSWWGFSLPVPLARSVALGNAFMQNVTNAQFFAGVGLPGGFVSGNLVGSATVLVPIVGQNNSGILQPTLPFTWAAGSSLYLSGTYERGAALMERLDDVADIIRPKE